MKSLNLVNGKWWTSLINLSVGYATIQVSVYLYGVKVLGKNFKIQAFN